MLYTAHVRFLSFEKRGTAVNAMLYLFSFAVLLYPFHLAVSRRHRWLRSFSTHVRQVLRANKLQILTGISQTAFSVCPSDMFSLSLRDTERGKVQLERNRNVDRQHVHVYPHMAIKNGIIWYAGF